MAKKGILLTAENDLMIVNGSLVVGETDMQEVAILLQLNQGELKSNPIIGANMDKFIRGNYNSDRLKSHLQTQLELIDLDYDDIKEKIRL